MVSSLLLSSNNRIGSSYWIRGSKHYFLTSFSYLNHYFHILVFLLLVSSTLSCLHGNPISRPVSSYLWYSKVLHCICVPPYFWHTSRVFSKQDACGNLVLESVPVFFPCSAICQRFLMQTSIGRLHTFSSHMISLNWHFLAWHKPPLSQHSTAWARNSHGISKLVNQGWLLLVWQQLLDDFPSTLCTWSHSIPVGYSRFAQFDSVGLSRYNILCRGFLNRPLPVGMHLKVSPKECHIFDWLLFTTA